MVLILALVGFASLPIYRTAIKWRACSLAAKALASAENKDMEGALSLARSAYHLRPMEPEVLRAVARVCDMRGDSMSLQFWQILNELPNATLEDRRGLVRGALERRALTPKIEGYLESILKSEPGSAESWLLKARALELGGNMELSTKAARRAFELDAGNEEIALFLGGQLLGQQDTYPEGMRILEALLAKPGKNGLFAAMVLVKQRPLAMQMAERLRERLEKDPLGSINHRLTALELAIQMTPTAGDALIAKAMEQYRKTGGDDLAAFGAWLNSHGVPRLALQAISREAALKDRQMLLVYLDALATEKNWLEVQKIVNTPGLPLEKVILELFKARCAQELGDDEGAGVHWRAAQSATLGNPEQAFYVARYARQCGRSSLAESIYRSLTVNTTHARMAYLQMLGLASEHGTQEVRALLKEMLTRWPNDEPVQNDYNYCSLLVQDEMRNALKTSIDAVQKSPGMIAYRTTLALAWLRLEKPELALEVYRGLEVDWQHAPAHFRAVFAATLWQNGKKEEAKQMAKTIRISDLRPEEKELVRFLE